MYFKNHQFSRNQPISRIVQFINFQTNEIIETRPHITNAKVCPKFHSSLRFIIIHGQD